MEKLSALIILTLQVHSIMYLILAVFVTLNYKRVKSVELTNSEIVSFSLAIAGIASFFI